MPTITASATANRQPTLTGRDAMLEVSRRIRTGATLEIIENTMHPRQVGQTRKILRVNGPRADVLNPAGSPAYIWFPTNGDMDRVRWYGPDIVQWRMGRDRESVDHKITYRVHAPERRR